MKLGLILGVALGACASGFATDSLAPATAVKIVDQRIPAFRSTTNGLVPDARSAGITVTDSNTVAAIVRAIENAPGKWKKGSFTAPAGYKRFIFLRDSQMVAAIGLGEQFLVRGSGGNWEHKKITRKLEEKINALGRQEEPNPENGANGTKRPGSGSP